MFDLAASSFNCWSNGLVTIEIWLCLYIKFNGNIKIFIDLCNFDFFFDFDAMLHISDVTIMS